MKRISKRTQLFILFLICLPLSLPGRPPNASNHSSWYTGMVAADYDGDGRDEIAFDFGSQGIWIYDSNASPDWFMIASSNPEWMVAARILQSSHYELVVGLAGNTWWWNYDQSDNPTGGWKRLYNAYASHAYAVDVDGEEIDEIVMFFDTLGVVILDYTGTGANGGFDAHWLEPIGWPGYAVRLDGGDEELVHDFGSYGLKYWDYRADWPAVWTRISWNNLAGQGMGLDLDGDPEEEFLGDYAAQGTWIYNFKENAWSRVNWADLLFAWPVAFNTLGADYEVLTVYGGATGLWMYDGSDGSWTRINWAEPSIALGANILTSTQGGNDGEEVIADFESQGVWVQKKYAGDWERISWDSPESMIKVQIDDDFEDEVLFDFGGAGVWIWDAAAMAWTKISPRNPEAEISSLPHKSRS